MTTTPNDALLDALRAIVGSPQVLTATDDDGLDAYHLDWRRRWRGRSLAVVRPGSTAEVAAILRTCHHQRRGLPCGTP
ncbi:MAG TPA: hypothetical protein PLL72_04790, partial [Burkholderiaceae bacterium]|nr:hypothetical protein [Burkholderiaceae bacterium]